MPKRASGTPPESFDEPWKQIVVALFQPFLVFFAPTTAATVDWRREPVFLDKELRRIAKGFGRKRRSTADFLVKVWLMDGGEQWLIIHIELQAQRETAFPERMFLYNVRAYDLYRKPVMSLAILADGDPNWRPAEFGYQSGASRMHMWYSVVKLTDYNSRQAELEASANPFALAVLAHLKTLETRGNSEGRLQWKLQLARLLFDRRWSRKEVEELFQFLDWIMTLAPPEEDRFEAAYTEMEDIKTMREAMPPLMRRAAVREARSLLLRLGRKRLGEPGDALEARIEGISNKERLEALCERLLDVESWTELFAQS